ncbi:MAG: hypothetical protein KAY31_03600 [Flavobacterium sp.]|nr:hypothetical protein [Flavobacterium sp.]
MKAIRLLFAGLFLITLSSQAQVSVNVNIGTPPAWGPVGYTEVRYYYIPDIEVYYDVPSAMFIYFHNGGWVRTTYLPYRYRHYDLYGAYKVCLDDYGPNPYIYYKKHKVKYHHGYRGPHQRTIGVRPNVVYNGPRDGYYREQHRDRDDDRNYYRQENRRNDRDNDNYRNDFRGGREKGNGKGHEPGRGHGNGNGRGNGNGKRG